MTNNSGFKKVLPLSLVKRAQDGDIEAFEVIYQTYADACYSLAYRICGQTALAQDIVHDSFVKVMKNIHQYRFQGVFVGWLRQVVTRETINRIKQQNNVSWCDDEVNDFESDDLFTHDWLEACHDLDKLLSKLTEVSRAVIWLHEVEGYTHQEIGDLFERSESFSKVTLSRAYSKLKQLIQVNTKRVETCI